MRSFIRAVSAVSRLLGVIGALVIPNLLGSQQTANIKAARQSIATLIIGFDNDGSAFNEATGQRELPETVGVRCEAFPERYSVEWKDGAVPKAAALKIPRSALQRRLEPPSIAELRQAGIAEGDVLHAHAFQLALYTQKVYPYGTRPVADDAFDSVYKVQLRKLIKKHTAVEPLKDETKGEADEGETSDGGLKDKPKPAVLSHYERRKLDLARIADEDGGHATLAEILDELGEKKPSSKQGRIEAILKAEFPKQHADASK